jgi:hypothetical protein
MRECPICQAPEGQPCRDKYTGQPFTSPVTHRARYAPAPQPSPNDHQTAAPVTNGLAVWRKALADHARTLRNKRGKRPPPPVTGIIIPRQNGKSATDREAGT